MTERAATMTRIVRSDTPPAAANGMTLLLAGIIPVLNPRHG
jgi:hypothetical protein